MTVGIDETALDQLIEDHRSGSAAATRRPPGSVRRGVASAAASGGRGVSPKRGSLPGSVDRCAVFGRQIGLTGQTEKSKTSASGEGSGVRPAASRHNAGGKFGAKHVDADMRAEMTIFDSLPGSCRAILANAPFNYVPSAILAQLRKGRSVEDVCETMRASIRAHLDAAYKSRGIAR